MCFNKRYWLELETSPLFLFHFHSWMRVFDVTIKTQFTQIFSSLILPLDWLSAPVGCFLWGSAPSNLHSAAKHRLSRPSSPPPGGEGSDCWRPNKWQLGPRPPARWWPPASETCDPNRISGPHLREREKHGAWESTNQPHIQLLQLHHKSLNKITEWFECSNEGEGGGGDLHGPDFSLLYLTWGWH